METGIFILGVMFWLLVALAIVCLLSIIYIKVMYYKWDKQDRQERKMIEFMNNQKVE